MGSYYGSVYAGSTGKWDLIMGQCVRSTGKCVFSIGQCVSSTGNWNLSMGSLCE